MRCINFLLFIVMSFYGFSQESNSDNKKLGDTVIVNSKKIVLNKYPEIIQIDSLWKKEMDNSPLTVFNNFEKSSTKVDEQELTTELLKKRLKLLNSKTPFHIDYNIELERTIRSYLKTRRRMYAQIMERAPYYFPLFEEKLDLHGIPLEMKYLAVMESGLNPNAKSPAGAAGLWQFMFQTGKLLNLEINSYIDERADPWKSTEAACIYFDKLYTIFGNWHLALAAYNAGSGNVTKAMRKAGGSTNYWKVRKYLPKETVNFVPSFYATVYIFEFAKEHNIIANESTIKYYETDTIQIKKEISFKRISQFLEIDEETISFLNPQYKINVIPFVKGKNYNLVVSIEEKGKFIANEDLIYDRTPLVAASQENDTKTEKNTENSITYSVKSGDFLGKIANKYGVSVGKIKSWNNLKSTNLKIGQKLIINPNNNSSSSNSSPSNSFVTYIVKSGDSLWTITKKFKNVSVQNIKEWNNIWDVNSLKKGLKLKIYNN